jgi:DNA-binding response OmpR family regulator
LPASLVPNAWRGNVNSPAAAGDEYIVKPIRPKMLKKRVLHWMAK